MPEAQEWKGKSPDELADALQKLKKEQFNLRFQRANGQLENTSRPREVRRDIARILTVMNERSRHPEMAVPRAAAPRVAKEKEEVRKPEKAEKPKREKKPAKRAAKKK